MPDAAPLQGEIDPGDPAFSARTVSGQHIEPLVLRIDGEVLTAAIIVDRCDAGRTGDVTEINDDQLVIQRRLRDHVAPGIDQHRSGREEALAIPGFDLKAVSIEADEGGAADAVQRNEQVARHAVHGILERSRRTAPALGCPERRDPVMIIIDRFLIDDLTGDPIDLEQLPTEQVVDPRPLGIETPTGLSVAADTLRWNIDVLSGMDRARSADDLGGDVGDAIAEILERQLLEGHVGKAAVGRRIARTLIHLDHRVGFLILGAEIDSIDSLVIAVGLALRRRLGEVDQQLAVRPDPADRTGRTSAKGDGEGREIAIADHGLTTAALPCTLLLPLLDQRPCPDDIAGDAHRAVDLGDAHAVGRGLDLEIAETWSFDLATLATEQLAADEGADQPAGLGRSKERADGGAGSSDSELGHGSDL